MIQKPKLLYASPIPPHKSGIANYSDVLLEALQEHFEITLFIEPMAIVNLSLYDTTQRDLFKALNPKLFSRHRVLQHGIDPINFRDYDLALYNFGNNPHYHSYMYHYAMAFPGLVILHDFVLYYLTVGTYMGLSRVEFMKKMRQIGGIKALKLFANLKLRRIPYLQCPSNSVLPLNGELFASTNHIMVHSQDTAMKVLQVAPHLTDRITVVPHLNSSHSQVKVNKTNLIETYGIDPNSLIISSFGYIADTKMNDIVCEAVQLLNSEGINCAYFMVGEGHFADRFIDNRRIFKTGFLPMSDFESFIAISDVVANLRRTSMGESSGSLTQILNQAKPCLVSEIGSFSELPSDAVIKIDNHKAKAQVLSQLRVLLQSQTLRQQVGHNAKSYVDNFLTPQKIAKDISQLLLTKAPRLR